MLLLVGVAGAQTRFSYSSGQPLEPAYEGWMQNPDGSYTLYFGYQNTNWVQEFDIPIGPENNFSPGNADLGQPTHFYPRRNPFLFTIQVPKDFGTKEIVWTLTANGVTRKAFGSIKTDYLIDPQVISTEVGGDNGNLANDLRTNIPPDLKVEGTLTRTVKVGQPLSLVAIAGDPDNLPPRRDGKPQPGVKKSVRGEVTPRPAPPPNSPAAVYRPPVAVTASAGPGLHLSWIVYRGKASAVKFTPDQMKTWNDTRAYGNSMWSPPYEIPVPPADGKWTADAVFDEPGTYVLRAVASDGSLFTYENVTVTVTP
ncbi:MAG TPA: hypothetical protein VM032_19985 [Vicinamibacterales bacterium]|nr:hypothetical protein [Vicinamibacterales bacterium]